MGSPRVPTSVQKKAWKAWLCRQPLKGRYKAVKVDPNCSRMLEIWGLDSPVRNPRCSRTGPGEELGDLQTPRSWCCDVHTHWRSYHAIEQPVELCDLQFALLVPELALTHSMPDSLPIPPSRKQNVHSVPLHLGIAQLSFGILQTSTVCPEPQKRLWTFEYWWNWLFLFYFRCSLS